MAECEVYRHHRTRLGVGYLHCQRLVSVEGNKIQCVLQLPKPYVPPIRAQANGERIELWLLGREPVGFNLILPVPLDNY